MTNQVLCAWCGRPFAASTGAGRPRRYCKRSCRQRDYEARQRSAELGLAESDLVVARREIDHLDDLIYVLGCAIEDVERDTAADPSGDQLRQSLAWLLEAARPLIGAGERLRTG